MLATWFHLQNCFFGRKLEDLSLDEFLLSGAFDSAGEDESEEETYRQNGLNKKKKGLKSATSNTWVLFCSSIIYILFLFLWW